MVCQERSRDRPVLGRFDRLASFPHWRAGRSWRFVAVQMCSACTWGLPTRRCWPFLTDSGRFGAFLPPPSTLHDPVLVLLDGMWTALSVFGLIGLLPTGSQWAAFAQLCSNSPRPCRRSRRFQKLRFHTGTTAQVSSLNAKHSPLVLVCKKRRRFKGWPML
mgnify:CR=1 FL=1